MTTSVMPESCSVSSMCGPISRAAQNLRASVRSVASVFNPKASSTATTPRVASEIGAFSTNSAFQMTSAFSVFDRWTKEVVARVEIEAQDVRTADSLLRRIELGLRAPDAINIAVAERFGAELATFDRRMAAAARTLGVQIATI